VLAEAMAHTAERFPEGGGTFAEPCGESGEVAVLCFAPDERLKDGEFFRFAEISPFGF
jgi:hypothetical protein